MQERFGLVTGLSDHTLDDITSICSIALGASIIEKHVTLDRSGGGPDDSFSLENDDLAALCTNLKIAWRSRGCVNYGRKSSELGNVKFRRSLYFIKNMRQGDIITADSIKSVRPGYGIAPKHIDELIGKKVTIDVEKNTPVRWESL
mgnify:FL=1